MSHLDRHRVEQEARHGGTDLGRSTRYSEAVNRYLSASGYGAAEPARPAPLAATPAAARTR